MHEFQEMEEMMKLLLKTTMDSRTNAVVYRNKANANACQVQWLAKYSKGALGDQVSLLHGVVETLLQALSCSSTLTSVSATLDKVSQIQTANPNPNPIPAEVITKIAQGTTSDEQVSTTETKVTPDKSPATTVKPSQQEVEQNKHFMCTTRMSTVYFTTTSHWHKTYKPWLHSRLGACAFPK
jgi:hypothetical protein